MTANELRIGNWVVNSVTGRIVKVHEVLTSRILIATDHPNEVAKHTYSPLSSYSGIPLTPEVLIQYGFVTGHSDYYFKNGIEVNIKDEELNGIGSIPLQYLHQLQNLYFALTGTELEYDPTMSETMKFLRSK